MKFLDAILRQTLRAIFTAIADVNEFAFGDVVRVGGHFLDQFEVLAYHAGDLAECVDEPRARHQAASHRAFAGVHFQGSRSSIRSLG